MKTWCDDGCTRTALHPAPRQRRTLTRHAGARDEAVRETRAKATESEQRPTAESVDPSGTMVVRLPVGCTEILLGDGEAC